jgi:hypothetical protein
MRAGLAGGGVQKKDSNTYGPLTCPYRSTFRAVGIGEFDGSKAALPLSAIFGIWTARVVPMCKAGEGARFDPGVLVRYVPHRSLFRAATAVSARAGATE